jgi:hypothetical protein
MTRLAPVCIGVLVVAVASAAIGFDTSATARVAVQGTPTMGTPRVATPTASQAASPYLVGNALSLLPPGEPGVLDTIVVGGPVDYDMLVVLRNNTGETVVLTGVQGTAHDASGSSIGEGTSGSFMSPSVLAAGQAALVHVYFNSAAPLPADAVFAFAPEAEPLATANVFRQDLEIVEPTREDQRLVGMVRNGTEEPLVGKVSVLGACFDAAGAITDFALGFADALDLGPGESTTFEVRLTGTEPCEAFLVSASGFKKS